MKDSRKRFQDLLKSIFQYQQDKLSLDFGVYRVFRHKAEELERFLEIDLPKLAETEANRHGVLTEDTYNDVLEFFSRYYQDGDFYPIPRFGKNQRHVLFHNGEETLFTWANKDQYYIKSLTGFSEYIARDILSTNELFKKAKNALTFRVIGIDDTRGDAKKTRYFVLSPDKTEHNNEKGLIVCFQYVAEKDAAVTVDSLQVHLKSLGFDVPAEVLEHHLNRFKNLRKSDFFIHRNLKGFLHEQLDLFVKSEIVALDDLNSLGRALAVTAIGAVVIDFLDTLEKLQQRLWEKRKLVHSSGYIVTLDRLAQWAPEWLESNLDAIVQKERLHWLELELGNYTDSGAVLAEHCDPAKQGRLTLTDPQEQFLPLPVDTRHFDQDFTQSMLAAISVSPSGGAIDPLIDGWAIYSDNWQALNTLNERFQNAVQCIYIDPDYNRQSTAFPYKDGYKRSSWVSLMRDRLAAVRPLMTDIGAIFVSIDHYEQRNLQHVLDETFGPANRIEELVWAQNTMDSRAPAYSSGHEFVEVYAKNKPASTSIHRMYREARPGYTKLMSLVEELNKDYPPISDIEDKIRELFEIHKKTHLSEMESRGIEDTKIIRRADPWSALYEYRHAEYRDDDNRFVETKVARKKKARIWVFLDGDLSAASKDNARDITDTKHPNYRHYKPKHPVTGNPTPPPKGGYRCPYRHDPDNPQRQSFTELDNDHRIYWRDDGRVARIKRFLHEVGKGGSDDSKSGLTVVNSVFSDFADGTKEVENLFGRKGIFPFPKPTTLMDRFMLQTTDPEHWVMDFFAGSGTTGHSAMEISRRTGERRRFLLVDAGEHYHDVLIPRLCKVAASASWKDGKPEILDGDGLFLKVFTLEQYEESLENCTLQPEQPMDIEARMDALGPFAPFPDLYRDLFLTTLPHFAEEQSPALLTHFDDDWLVRPFEMSLTLQGRSGEYEQTPVDLVESFSLWLGQPIDYVQVLEYQGLRRLLIAGGGTVCWWRDLPSSDQIDEAYVIGDMDLLRTTCSSIPIELEMQKLYINGIAQHHVHDWLPANAKETLYALRSLMMNACGSVE